MANKHRITILGFCLLVVLALAAIAASSAFAGEYGTCSKVEKVEIEYKTGVPPKEKTEVRAVDNGKYANKECTEEAAGLNSVYPGAVYKSSGLPVEGNNGKYEWIPYPGAAGTLWGYTSKGKEATLESPTGKITCAKNTDVGKVTGVKTDEDTVTFEDCTNSVFGTPCYNVEAAKESKKGGTIVTFPDLTVLIDHGEKGASGGEPAEGEAWEEFVGTTFLEEVGPYPLLAVFYCKTPLGEDPFFVTGTVSGTLSPVNAMSKKELASFGVGKGEQDEVAITVNPETLKVEPFPSTQTAEDQTKNESKTEVRTGAGAGEGPKMPPTVSTRAASAPTETSATLNASVNPNGSQVTECRFEYGTTMSYGTSLPCSPAPGGGSGAVAVSASVTGLTANTTIHFRITAVSVDGTSRGADGTFTTLSNTATAETFDPDEPATAQQGPLTGTASGGIGAVSVGQYSSDPVGAAPAGSSGAFVNVGLSEGSTFTSIQFTDCELRGVRKISWWNPQADGGAGEWQRVSDETPPTGNPACITVTINETTSPDLADVDGVVFDPEEPMGPEPSIKKVTPKKGSIEGGTVVEIAGKNFHEVEEVRFGPNVASVIEYTSELIKVTSPAGAVGTTDVRVTTETGTSPISNKDHFKYVGTPTVTGVHPEEGLVAGGLAVTVEGKGFGEGIGPTTFKFGTKAATEVECPTTTECTMKTPKQTSAGPVEVVAKFDGGKSPENPPGSTFSYH